MARILMCEATCYRFEEMISILIAFNWSAPEIANSQIMHRSKFLSYFPTLWSTVNGKYAPFKIPYNACYTFDKDTKTFRLKTITEFLYKYVYWIIDVESRQGDFCSTHAILNVDCRAVPHTRYSCFYTVCYYWMYHIQEGDAYSEHCEFRVSLPSARALLYALNPASPKASSEWAWISWL